MKLIDFKTNEDLTFKGLRCHLLISKKLLSEEGRIKLIENNHYKLMMKDQVYDFSVLDPQDAKVLTDKLKHYPYNLACVSFVQNNSDDFFLHVAFFYDASRDVRLSIVLSQKVKDLLERKHLVSKRKDFNQAVRDNFILSDGINCCYAYTKGKYKFTLEESEEDTQPPQDYNVQEDSEDQLVEQSQLQDIIQADTQQPDQNRFQTIKLYGQDYSFILKLKGSEDSLYLSAESVDIQNRHIPPMALKIGDLTFTDSKTYLSEKTKKELEITSGYLEIWNRYTDIEGDFLLEKAREIGEIKINRNKVNREKDGLIIYPEGFNDEKRKLVAEGDYLLFSEQLPIYIESENMTWKEFYDTIELLSQNDMPKNRSPIRKIKRIENGYWVIDPGDTGALPEGVITYSIHGDMQQIIRRKTARELIEKGESAFPALGLVIEGKKSESLIESERSQKIEPITAFVKQKIFGYEPRPRQRDAIEIALNTPDIAIIQGPPGTGKTTVITAIIERLNEISDKRKNQQGQVLITSFQHDAVRNVIERLSINSLPTIKFGKQGEEDLSQEKIITKWCEDYVTRLKQRNPSLQQTAEQKEFERKHNMYLSSPNDTNAVAFLTFAKQMNTDYAVNEEIDRLLDEIKLEESTEPSRLLEKIRRLRTTKEGFADDGPDTADDLLEELEKNMRRGIANNDDILRILETAADNIAADPEPKLLAELANVKRDLLKRCISRPCYKIEKPQEEILAVYARIANGLSNVKNAEDEILYNLLNELEGNSSDVEATVASYNFVYAATAQQSEGKDIRHAKNISKDEHPFYDTVIIDEAARVNPGDLMIPMAQAKRRIILVGDHRQLPHIYNEEIFESMRDNGNNVTKDVVKISMFQYLKNKAEELSRQDGISRTVTLDAQYRMHPELGEFVNQNFYAPYGEGFESPLPADKFSQSLTDKPYMWIDVPHQWGAESKIGTSRLRMCEAKIVVDKLREYISSAEGSKLSYGVISFYSAQVAQIKKLLKDSDIADRVRVGSVDAFQGMEFDVIFLSIVRTHAEPPKIDYALLNKEMPQDQESTAYNEWLEYRTAVGMRNYGFLTSENRLCVALSRQKKLLIVVGDAAIFCSDQWSPLAEHCVPALKNFYDLCKEKGAVIDAKTKGDQCI